MASFLNGVVNRTCAVVKSTITAVSLSTAATRPRPNVSWVDPVLYGELLDGIDGALDVEGTR